jgi:hypothetical protein
MKIERFCNFFAKLSKILFKKKKVLSVLKLIHAYDGRWSRSMSHQFCMNSPYFSHRGSKSGFVCYLPDSGGYLCHRLSAVYSVMKLSLLFVTQLSMSVQVFQ